MLDFLQSSDIFREIIIPLLDILLLAFALYRIYTIFIQTRAVQLIRGLILILIFYLVVNVLQLRTSLWILNFLGPGLVIAIAIIFQPELRKMFTKLGQVGFLRFKDSRNVSQIDEILSALDYLAEHRRGALVAFVRSVGLKNIIESGQRIQANINSALIISIFGHDTALHDGAIVIQENTIVAASVFLPLSEDEDISRRFGTRHRAALGLVEESDALVLILSEETGSLSLAYDASLHYNLNRSDVRQRLLSLLRFDPSDTQEIDLEIDPEMDHE